MKISGIEVYGLRTARKMVREASIEVKGEKDAYAKGFRAALRYLDFVIKGTLEANAERLRNETHCIDGTEIDRFGAGRVTGETVIELAAVVSDQSARISELEAHNKRMWDFICSLDGMNAGHMHDGAIDDEIAIVASDFNALAAAEHSQKPEPDRQD